MTPFQILFRHIHDCSLCSHASKGVCAEGEKLLAVAVKETSEAMAPIPREAAKA